MHIHAKPWMHTPLPALIEVANFGCMRSVYCIRSWTRHTCWTEPMPCSAAVKLASKPCAIGQQPRQWIAENGHTRISNS
eukprot:scaffold296896_cov17-Tisochrysis_lutea.AAC.2